MPEWCVSYLACGGFSSLWLAGSHPRLEDGVVTRDIYGSHLEQCSYYRSDSIQVKACPGNYYVYKFTRPPLSIPSPTYCAGTFIFLYTLLLVFVCLRPIHTKDDNAKDIVLKIVLSIIE